MAAWRVVVGWGILWSGTCCPSTGVVYYFIIHHSSCSSFWGPLHRARTASPLVVELRGGMLFKLAIINLNVHSFRPVSTVKRRTRKANLRQFARYPSYARAISGALRAFCGVLFWMKRTIGATELTTRRKPVSSKIADAADPRKAAPTRAKRTRRALAVLRVSQSG